MEQTILGQEDSKKHGLKEVGKTLPELGKPPGEAQLRRMEEPPEAAEPCVLAGPTGRTQVGLGLEGRSLWRPPRTAIRSASTIVVSALQSSGQRCHQKVSPFQPTRPRPPPSSPSPRSSVPRC